MSTKVRFWGVGREEDAQHRSVSELFPAHHPLRAPISTARRSFGGDEDV